MEPERQSLHRLREAALRGEAASQSDLGGKYCVGEGVRQDYAEAVRWFQMAADQGFARA